MIVSSPEKKKIASSIDIYLIMKEIYSLRQEEDQHKEMFYCIGLNSNNTVLYIDMIAIGTVNQCTPPIREGLRLALLKDAVSIILIHNHPSGNTAPSTQDNTFTDKIKDAAQIMDIKILDHIIIGNDKYYSFADEGRI